MCSQGQDASCLPGKALSLLLGDTTFPTESQQLSLLPLLRSILLAESCRILLSSLTAPPQHCSEHALVGRTTVLASQSPALPGPRHTTTAPNATGNLTNTDQPTRKWELLGQVTRKQPELGLLFPFHKAHSGLKHGTLSASEASACLSCSVTPKSFLCKTNSGPQSA